MPASRYSPRSFVTASKTRPVERDVATTLAPGSTAFDSSMTTPFIVASCAAAGEANRIITARV